ncbi:hypothetical protein JST99_03080 [Candidatus Dependentiae bacterium]|nr:hypothetical protein [Candidatus Dependentiae bacterium]MCC7414966.1 hypothetical protein [Campylobacterota bacterium]
MSVGVLFDKVDMRYVGLAVTSVVLVAAGFAGYRWHRANKEQKAQEAFSSCMREYQRAERDPNLWPNAELVFKLAIEQNPSSSFTPSLLAYQAETLVQMGKPEQALECMNKAVELLSTSSELYHLYATKQALMMMDAADDSTKEKGLAVLTTLANNSTNNVRDMAQYYLGLYSWVHDDIATARAVWSELLPLAEADPASPWAERAAQKLNLV